MARYFVRCTDCLTVAAIESETHPHMNYSRVADVRCGACDSSEPTIEMMGQVQRDRLIQKHLACVCDDRCTCARGPICVCACGGKNHGIGLLAGTYLKTTDAGPVPVLKIVSTPKARYQALEYRRGVAAVRVVVDRLLDRKDAHPRQWLDASDYAALRRAQLALRTATGGRVHRSRMQALAPYVEASPAEARAILAELYAMTSATPAAVADVPFSLTAPVSVAGGKQESLF